MSLTNTQLFSLAREFSSSAYGNAEDPLSVARIQRAVVSASLNGNYLVAFEYPKAVVQAMAVESQGNTPDFDPAVLTYYKNALQAVVTAFDGSPFVLSNLAEGAGFKVSWSGATPPPAPAATTPAVTDVTAKDNVE